MDRTIVRNAAVSAVLVAGLGLSGLAMATQAHATESAKADTATTAKAATSAKADASGAADTAKQGAALVDGTYTGEAKGMESTIKVTVTVKDGKIADVKAEGQETEGIGSKAIEQLPEAIVKAGGTEGVDGVSGASVTSKAIFSAVDQALESAQGGTAASAASSSKDKASSSQADSESAEKAATTTKSK